MRTVATIMDSEAPEPHTNTDGLTNIKLLLKSTWQHT